VDRRANYAASVPRKALITGGAGFVGSHLAELLVGDGWEVYALDDLSTGSDANVFQLAGNPHFHLTVESVLATADLVTDA
jgi:nucleoside-diphosphate-sugar epimerase